MSSGARDTSKWIYVMGAHQHNLKHINVKIPQIGRAHV